MAVLCIIVGPALVTIAVMTFFVTFFCRLSFFSSVGAGLQDSPYVSLKMIHYLYPIQDSVQNKKWFY